VGITVVVGAAAGMVGGPTGIPAWNVAVAARRITAASV